MEVRKVEDAAMLISPSEDTSLLARKVNYEPLINVSPKISTFPIEKLSTVSENPRTQEALVIQDLLNALIGISGVYIRYSNDYDPTKGDALKFRIAKHMDSSLKSFCRRILNLGTYYVELKYASEQWSDPIYGLVLQRLGFEIKTFLNNVYLKFVVDKLEKEFYDNSSFSIRELKQLITDSEVGKKLGILFALYLEIKKEMEKRRHINLDKAAFDNLMSESSNDFSIFMNNVPLPIAKGGIILQILEEMISKNLGDRSTVTFMKSLLNAISESYCQNLHEWVTQGELRDPYDEFMICNTMKSSTGIDVNPTECYRIWLTQYSVRRDGLPKKFLINAGNHDNKLLSKILFTGKLLNLIKLSLQITKLPIPTDEHILSINYSELMEGTNLELYVNKWYDRANSICMKLLFEDYKVDRFIILLQKHLFGYRNGNLITKLLHNNIYDLTKAMGKSESSEEKLQQSLEFLRIDFAEDDLIGRLLVLQLDERSFDEFILDNIRTSKNASNMVQETERTSKLEGLSALKTYVLEGFKKNVEPTNSVKSNIYHLNFDVAIPYPINVIINRAHIYQFQIISRYLNLLRYHTMVLDDTWIEINKNPIWRHPGFSDIVYKGIIQRTRILHNKMNHFFKCIMEYFTNDIIDKEMSQILNNVTSVNDLQTKLSSALTNILNDCCLTQLIEMQLQIFDITYKFCRFIASMRYKLCKIDYNLYEKYIASRKSSSNDDNAVEEDDGYNEEDAIRKVPELIGFINTVSLSFHQHYDAFIEGLLHSYSNQVKGHFILNTDSGRLLHSLVGNELNELLSSVDQ
ncbi:hypothetical protein KAFR_0E02290 [Kazachstania africana CBS 2517]|uniref:Spindle pole body component n=1 Tax=Kazachstania africana (strain ATCC 22294 / BCRC 22015 / CBS 2517 / CECT 1963 / NBRC 1671 / NRRL Y-8276) TaxID=1071382 RepID=H2AVI2_KAZAF|nr:hypothetical protein KAFR_0E02290 [Kazachstania africana CBS 2517]CCF58382.1 hypothetical protein KAFR_0E02290 [Kazachstania africana CBS 2517]